MDPPRDPQGTPGDPQGTPRDSQGTNTHRQRQRQVITQLTLEYTQLTQRQRQRNTRGQRARARITNCTMHAQPTATPKRARRNKCKIMVSRFEYSAQDRSATGRNPSLLASARLRVRNFSDCTRSSKDRFRFLVSSFGSPKRNYWQCAS